MPLVVQKLEGATVKEGSPGGYCPLIRCAHCRRLVARAADGVGVWAPDENETYLSVEFLHEGCLEGYADGRDADLDDFDLARLVSALAHNLEVEPAGGAG